MNTTKGRTLHDAAEIIGTCQRLFVAGQKTELRALEATTAGDRYPRTWFGFFDNSQALAAAVGAITTAKGVYIIPNLVNPDLLARACNRIKPAGKGDATQDGDILRRRWFLLDADPVRPAGISSTDAEHAAALARIERIAAELQARGWPGGILADSGNGGHGMFPIDLPADDGGIVQRCLQALAARFDDAAVKVDTAVYNPARIWKLYGTMACKGDDVPGRPWRLARILQAPDTLRPVPVGLLQALASEAPQPQPAVAAPRQDHGPGEPFDIESFIRRHGLEADGPHDWNGQQGYGRKWTFRKSPMCDHHGDGPFILQHASGAITAGCHHASCKWTWQDLRQRYEPKDTRPVNISGIVGTQQGTTAAPAPWPELDPLDEQALPEFPLQALPGILQEWVAAESHATQTPKDLAGLLALAAIAAGIARHVDIEPQPGWREPVNLFVAVLLEPGNRKSAVFSDATRPLRDAEAAMIEAARPAVAREQSERRQAVKRLERLEKLAADKTDAAAAAEAAELAERLALWLEPVLPRLIVDDATSEKLGMMLAEQGGRIASMSPEGGVFDLMAGLYSKSGMPQFGVYLMGHAGDDLRVDRVSRKAVHVERPALTCAYAMQPAVIDGLADNVAFRGRGLLGRFLYAAPASWIGKREIRPAPVPAAVADAYAALVKLLAATPPQGTFTLRGDAARRFHGWQAEVETMLGDGGDLESTRDWGGKLAGATARLAAVLHCAKHPGDAMRHDIESDTIRAVVELGEYLIPHAEAVLTMMQARDDTTDDDARYVLRWIVRHGRREFTKRDAYQDCKRRFPKAEDIDPALGELARRGYLRPKPQETSGPGRAPSPVFEVNPAVFDSGNTENRPHNPQNSNCGDSGGAFGQSKPQNPADDEWGQV